MNESKVFEAALAVKDDADKLGFEVTVVGETFHVSNGSEDPKSYINCSFGTLQEIDSFFYGYVRAKSIFGRRD